MNILITRGSGFVGSDLCVKLKTKNPNSHITALDNLRRRGSELNLNRLKISGVEFVHGDSRNSKDLIETEGVDLIIDASADPGVLSGIVSAVYPL